MIPLTKITGDKLEKPEQITSDFSDKIFNFPDKQDSNKNGTFSEDNINITKVITSTDSIDKANMQSVNGESSLAEVPENTDPNYAYLLPFDQSIVAEITAAGQTRWYGAIMEVNRRIMPVMSSTATADFDLYVYKLNQSTMTLNYVASSTNDGNGFSEILDLKANAGDTYYFMVHGYSGVGPFQLTLYSSSYDFNYEINNDYENATYIASKNSQYITEREFSITGVIDSPIDKDIYMFRYPDAYADLNFDYVRAFFKLDTPSGCSYDLIISNGNERILADWDFGLKGGKTYYLEVRSRDGSYSNSKPYTIKMSCVKYVPGGNMIFETTDRKNIFQNLGNKYYTNGHQVGSNWYHEQHETTTNPTGYLDTYHNLFWQGTEEVTTAAFINFFQSYTGTTSSNAMLLKLKNTRLNYTRYGGGAYSNEKYTGSASFNGNETTPVIKDGPIKNYILDNIVYVVVDCNTGDVIDVLSFNLWYLTSKYYNYSPLGTVSCYKVPYVM